MFEEIRKIDCQTTSHSWNWTLLDAGKPTVAPDENLNDDTLVAVADYPGPRTAVVFSRYGSKIMLFGGSGPYITLMKSRRAYYDIFQFDTLENKWFEDKRPIKGRESTSKRINHAGDVLGCVLAVFGGYDSEARKILDDLVLFDIEEHAWINGVIHYEAGESDRISARAKHSVTTIYCKKPTEVSDDDPKSIRWDRQLWFNSKLQKTFKSSEFKNSVNGLSQFSYGIFIFGGYSNKSETALGDLWLLQPDCIANEGIVVDEKDPTFIRRNSSSPYLLGYSMHIRAINMSKLTKGRPPAPRYAHQTCSLQNGKYLVISGGRSNELFKTMGNIALNDFHLLNTQRFEWETLAMYGPLPLSRWNHSIVNVDEDKLLIFGGLNMTTYMNSSSLLLFKIGDYAIENYTAKAKGEITDLQRRSKLSSTMNN